MKLLNVYPRWNIEPVKAQGCKIYDRDGVEYLDFYGGHAVISIGHSHPEYVRRIKQQIDKIGFYSNSVLISLQDEYAEKLGNVSAYPDYSLFMVNSGAEANENALKLAAFHNRRKKVVAFRKSFHGRTSATVRVTDISRYWSSIDGVSEVVFLSLGDTDSLKEELGQGDVSSVIIEGIQGVGGVIVPNIKFFQDLRIVCDQTDTVLILDEIQSGFGRSGRFFAHQYAGIRPDLITVAKGMGNGFPVSGVLVSPKFAAVMGQLGTTFGGNHLACMAGIAVLDVMEKENLVMNSDRVGRYLMDKLKKLPKVKEVRGLGLMIGIEFEEPIEPLRDKLLFEQKVFTGATGAHVFRLLPPLCLNKELADEFLDRFCRVLLR
ncbi:aspartate aminotransferase family protein [Candidatus Azobacteroides pseudotrichonymphae]|uniref:Acetylornithine aminotransferase n=1 Tax=Azobacteroides pseudotrichonymphae genomovar. CFP2 TaxID=511995 RepID=B6YQW4_AZOPC|nr:aminotransferase class III-fold pyridoxal phosphate-dependent enzyme [Candidatus Azobacteroides pseudotrichonymphae]BAG83586.1 acetylornithine aminotransferase [Candidatus Azobacteroides pseudotrichonymphae genomovar. CFP2]